jgi:hypothetical protein
MWQGEDIFQGSFSQEARNQDEDPQERGPRDPLTLEHKSFKESIFMPVDSTKKL